MVVGQDGSRVENEMLKHDVDRINRFVEWLHTVDYDTLQAAYSTVNQVHTLRHMDPEERASLAALLNRTTGVKS